MKNSLEIFFITIVFLLICIIYKDQPLLSHNNGQGWDGKFYYEVTEQIITNNPVIYSEKPFVNRLGTPFLIAKLTSNCNLNILESGKLVNIAGFYFTIILLLFWLRRFIKNNVIRILVISVFMISWFLPLRISFFEPITSDAWGAFFFISGVILLDNIRLYIAKYSKIPPMKILLFTVIVSIGSTFRESNIVLGVALFFIGNPIKRQNLFKLKELFSSVFRFNNWRFLLLFLPILATMLVRLLISFKIQDTSTDYSYIKALFFWFYNKSLPQFLLGILNSIGPLVVLLPFFTKKIKSLLVDRQELSVLLFFSLFFGYFAGGDTERIFIMSSFPILLIWIGYSIEGILLIKRKWWLFVIMALQTVAFRFYWYLPDFPGNETKIPIPFFTMLGSDFNYLFLYSYHGNYVLNSLILAEYVLLFVITWFVINKELYLKR